MAKMLVRIRIRKRQGQQPDHEKRKDDPTGQHKDLVSENRIPFSHMVGREPHIRYLSSSKETPKSPAGRISRTRIMIDRATEPFKKAPLGIRKTTIDSAKPRM